ncbi:TetR/AcrR family transcriptional regulator C-terminal domain-containing protein [Carnobacteriaceae bacterium zg-ZUI78]|uniref:TetR/AcrR family transcriptional regulator n=1 Tax=Granulicatella sp. zg-84 TaxID=2678503 RepID=UPI0013BFEC21|nr:TetR/AcrR family transcriptional regulator C-terminal domain-containing protein [Granulicatella sp. zg-84]MBS4750521.1 TetR/AcrR family transcriptional regulator C-terminal domain-containing protein [Carnobacteriaceae bacterium zg-ZUI78]NEW66084.1 TetR family transcriptional regulator [Granulicatella sp. zg-84]QMI85475.1 TetR/AcrR family transcriptional regulator C-terminal domain-containing protein [Carnobacteriaceae bacterium zg-84]
MQQRHTETKTLIKKVFTTLLLKHDFETITISMITREARINRGTFYLHYLDKYDLLEQLKQELTSNLFNIILIDNPNEHTIDIIIEALTYLKKNFDFIYALSMNQSVHLAIEIRKFLEELLKVAPVLHQKISQYKSLPFLYAKEVFFSSMEAIILYWIKTGANETPQEMAQILNSI